MPRCERAGVETMGSEFFQRTGRTACVALALFVFSASAVFAQAIVDARRIEFTPSADHNAIDPDGTILVTSYSLQVVLAGTTTVVQTVNLGKPTPETDGMIRLDFVALLPAALVPGVGYEALLTALGPGGSSAASRSNGFSFTPICNTPSISPAGQSVGAAAGSGSSNVTAGAGCPWGAISNSSWITLTSGPSGSGDGTATFSFSANTAATSRVGTLTIAGATFTLTQAGASCSYTISSTSQSVAASGGTGTVSVTAGTGCAWTATSGASWVTITSGATGSGGGSGVHCRGEHRRYVALSHAHNRWKDFYRKPGGGALHVHRDSGGAHGSEERRVRHNRRHHRVRMRMVCLEPSVMDHRQRIGNRQRRRDLHSRSKRDHRLS